MDTRKLLLKATDIENMTGERKVHFLNPNAVRINKSLGDAVGLNQIGVHLIYVEPGWTPRSITNTTLKKNACMCCRDEAR